MTEALISAGAAVVVGGDTKPEEFAEYNAFVERIKEEERNV